MDWQLITAEIPMLVTQFGATPAIQTHLGITVTQSAPPSLNAQRDTYSLLMATAKNLAQLDTKRPQTGSASRLAQRVTQDKTMELLASCHTAQKVTP
jgi:hypothetical protein